MPRTLETVPQRSARGKLVELALDYLLAASIAACLFMFTMSALNLWSF